ncbi:MAG: hypothetical protein NC177_12565 [Ruminococcus flavefaciens]|nr:hypothetical protein [Ruminococcus flavefaciens]
MIKYIALDVALSHVHTKKFFFGIPRFFATDAVEVLSSWKYTETLVISNTALLSLLTFDINCVA